MSKRVLFVDDDPEVLSGLKRMLWEMEGGWDMVFAESGREALEILAKRPIDVVVSDMRMPGMDGAQLLAEVMNKYPNIVRIVLSGHSEREMILKSVGPTHQYLSKPCDQDTLIYTVERACDLRILLEDESLKSMVTQLDTLPSLPSLYTEIIAELRLDNCSMKKVGEIISKDVGMTAKILQLVNSAFFGLPQHISTPEQAVTLLGLDTIRALVMSVHIFTQFDRHRIKRFPIDDISKHSLAIGVYAKEISRLERIDNKAVDDAFIAGLLHDVGAIVLAANLPEKYNEVLDLLEKESLKLHEAEQMVFKATHSEVGAYLLGLWGLPDPIVEAVFFHHYPMKSLDIKFSPITAVYAANTIDAELNPSNAGEADSQIDIDYLKKVGVADRFPIWKEACREIKERIGDER
ncbi:MAG: two-component system response regulator [bacterium]|nr:MAG: two-component system response regulator [bacterium]